MNEISSDQNRVSLLWTGGWDSTFQLLQLLFIHKCCVTPFYLIDEERRSTGIELLTMKRIKEHLYNKYPQTKKLLQPSQYFAVTDISPDTEISGAFQAVLEHQFIGGQYDWLARFCKQNKIFGLQLCIHRDDKAHAVIENLVSNTVERHQNIFQVDPTFRSTDEYVLFQYFSFPIFNISKMEMASISEHQGWNGIMAMTWFCQKPKKNTKPCGRCNPCLYTAEEGFGWRIPIGNRVLSRLERLLIHPIKAVGKRIMHNTN